VSCQFWPRRSFTREPAIHVSPLKIPEGTRTSTGQSL
jgi:hypothetical protein